MGKTTTTKAPALSRYEQVVRESSKRVEVLHELELKHQQGVSETELINKDEDARRLRLQIQIHSREAEVLREKLSEQTKMGKELSMERGELAVQLEMKAQTIHSQEQQLRKKERECSTLQAELETMNNLTQSSTTVLAEKLALSREFSVQKLELEHLRSQLAQQQNTLAEKLALDRQVNTLEVELANEKKAANRATQKRESNDRIEDELRKQLRETEKQLTSEKTQRERLEDQLAQEKETHQLALQDQNSNREIESELRKKLHEAQRQVREALEEKERLEEELAVEKRNAKKAQMKQSDDSEEEDELRAQVQQLEDKLSKAQSQNEAHGSEVQRNLDEAEARNDALEQKMEKLNAKLRVTREQLKKTQADLDKAQIKVQQVKLSVPEEVTGRMGKGPTSRKRKVQLALAEEMSQMTIGTPGVEDKPRRANKKAYETSLLAEKSTFSITPFLNKSKGMGLVPEEGEEDDDETPEDSILAQRGRKEDTATTTVDAEDDEQGESGPAQTEEPEAQPKARGRRKKPLGEAPSVTKNTQSKPQPKSSFKKTAKAPTFLDAVAEEGEPDREPGLAAATGRPPLKVKLDLPDADSNDTTTTKDGSGETTKKKRKVLGSAKNLFDDGDGEAAAPTKSGKAAAKKSSLTAVKLGGNSAFAGKAFSPLKRDRRGVGASFLS